ncbi:MAG: tRNA (N6-isopentenyl adenosine(37)-C2)-methylthiotransferase MiaB [Proteobacteria bacterium]|nr:tRNA (N6-isopentenyl adenosine(37)-C2)-methylthiotransferase MiaB [Pseudomonadota bacterium]
MEKFYIETYGCQMNEADSEYMASLLHTIGYERVYDIKDASIILVNTCSIRDKAEKKVLSFLGRAYPYKRKNDCILAVCGCVAQQEGENLIKKAPYLDIVFGPHHINYLPNFIKRARNNEKVVEVTERNVIERDKDLFTTEGIRAMIPIMQGCNNFCSFCIVPYVRGREVSRKPEDVIEEVKRLADYGIQEVMLLGQNVNSYGKDLAVKEGFVKLIEEISKIKKIERIRFTTSHPKDITEGLINSFATIEKLMPHIHLPVQSGSDRVLNLMNRKYSREDYLRIVKKLRQLRPDISITTDIIVGFPSETEDDFEDTLTLVKEVRYDSAFSFKYSKRPYTKASTMEDQIPEEIKQRRLEILQNLLKEIIYEKNKEMEGRIVPVLVESRSKKEKTEFMGRTPCFRIVNFSSNREIKEGETVKVKITRGFKNSLKGEFING